MFLPRGVGMKKKFSALLIALIVTAVSAQQPEILKTNNQTIFNKIAELYSAGTLVDLSKITDKIASGRCFTVAEPNSPLATYFVVNSEITDVGPIEPPIVEFTGMMQYFSSLPPSYFDADGIQKNDINIIQTRYPLIIQDPNTYVLNYELSKEALFLRQSGNYIVVLSYDRAGKQDAACYYFKIH